MHPGLAIVMAYYAAFNPFVPLMVAPYVLLEMGRLLSQEITKNT